MEKSKDNSMMDAQDKNINPNKIIVNNDFEHYCIPHIDILYKYAYWVTGKTKSAQMLVLKTFSKAFGFWKYFDSKEDSKGWLFRILKNIYQNDFTNKSSINKGYDPQEIDTIINGVKYDIKIDEQLLNAEDINLNEKDVSDLILTLPEDLKIVLILHDIILFSYEEIADYVDIPSEVVRIRLFRARKLLYSELKKRINISAKNFA